MVDFSKFGHVNEPEGAGALVGLPVTVREVGPNKCIIYLDSQMGK